MIHRVKFECRRGRLGIRGWEYRPAQAKGKLPVAVISHGFMANYKSVVRYAEKFAGWGWCVYIYDFCGGCLRGMSDGRTTDMSVLTEVEDLKAVIAYAKTRAYVDPDRLLLMGCSQGGFVSAMTAAQMPAEVGHLILFYPALCIPDDARKGSMMAAKFDPSNIPDVIRCGPMKLGRVYPASVLDMDPYEEIRSYPGPTLIVHGTADTIVNVSYAQRAYEEYTEGKPGEHPEKELTLIEDGAHGFSRRHDKIAVEAVERFLARG